MLVALVDPVQGLLVFLAGEHNRFVKLHPAADRHQHEQMQRIGTEIEGQLVCTIEPGDVVPGDRRVDLHRHPGRPQRLEAGNRFIERAGAAEYIVRRGIRPVETDRDAAKPGRHDSACHGVVDQCAVGRQGGRQTHGLGFIGQFEQVRAHERLAAREDEDRVAGLRQRANHRQCLLGSHVEIAQGLRHLEAAAVNARQVAARGRFPEEQPQRPGHRPRGSPWTPGYSCNLIDTGRAFVIELPSPIRASGTPCSHAERSGGDVLVGQIATRVGGPGVAGGLLGSGPKAAAAEFLESAGAATAFQQGKAVLESRHDCVGHVLPDLRELPPLDVPEGAIH